MEGDVPINCKEGGKSASYLPSLAKVITLGSFSKPRTGRTQIITKFEGKKKIYFYYTMCLASPSSLLKLPIIITTTPPFCSETEMVSFFLSQNKEMSDYASFAHDLMWTYALALDQLLRNDSSALDSIHSNSTSRYVEAVLPHLMGNSFLLRAKKTMDKKGMFSQSRQLCHDPDTVSSQSEIEKTPFV